MSDNPPEPDAKPARPLNRWGMGAMSILQTALLAVIVITLNYLAVHHFTRVDLSRDGDYTLSPATRRYLASKPADFDPRGFLKVATAAARDICKARFEAFGCAGQASKIKPVSLERMTASYAAAR